MNGSRATLVVSAPNQLHEVPIRKRSAQSQRPRIDIGADPTYVSSILLKSMAGAGYFSFKSVKVWVMMVETA